MHFKAPTFVAEMKSILVSGQKALDTLIEAYLWANQHLKEIHRFSPEYEQQWLRSETRRIFNVDLTHFVTTAKKLGGGASDEQFKAGRAIIDTVGIFEAFRAEKLLTTDQMKTIKADLGTGGPEEFRKIVDSHARKLERLNPDPDEKTVSALLKENLKLKRENDRLVAENAKLKETLATLKALV